ncbi:hypothetical protein DESC_660110 [Desulfosarcina cetonica]|nr:hypothetical protein DESC_660110 [Desulfosarcina cetonica]
MLSDTMHGAPGPPHFQHGWGRRIIDEPVKNCASDGFVTFQAAPKLDPTGPTATMVSPLFPLCPVSPPHPKFL